MLESSVYADFAEKHSVEFLVTEELDRALRDKNRLVRTYKATDPYGDPVEYLVEFPGVTIEQLQQLSNSKAVRYISTSGKIPYTSIVDPHTGKELEGVVGVRSVKEFIALISKHKKMLEQRYGKGVPRKVWNGVVESEIQVDMLLAQNKIFDAMGVYNYMARQAVRQPPIIRNRVSAALDSILEDAGKRIPAIAKEANDKKKRPALLKEAKLLARALKETPLEEKAAALVKKLK